MYSRSNEFGGCGFVVWIRQGEGEPVMFAVSQYLAWMLTANIFVANVANFLVALGSVGERC